MDNLDHGDVLIRTAKTFVAAFIPIFIAGLTDVQHAFAQNGLSGAKAALVALTVSAGAAAITAAWNYGLQIQRKVQ